MYVPLINPKKIILPTLLIKLELMKNVEDMDIEGNGFRYLKDILPQLSDAKLKEDLFIGLQIRKFLDDFSFRGKLNEKELAVWKYFVSVKQEFLGNKKMNTTKSS